MDDANFKSHYDGTDSHNAGVSRVSRDQGRYYLDDAAIKARFNGMDDHKGGAKPSSYA